MALRNRLNSFLLLSTTTVALAACTGGTLWGHGHDHASAGYQRLYSPNGEPLTGGILGHPACEDALAGWMKSLTASHDGSISHDVFMADANHQFDRMDLGHTGFITAADLATFRAPYEDPIQPEHPPQAGDDRTSRRLGPGAAAGNPPSPRPSGNLVDVTADPVMSADTSLRFKVSREDFLRQAEETFAHLDADHDGTLSRAEVMSFCPRKEP